MQLSTGIDEDVRRSRPPEATRPAGAAGPAPARKSEPSGAYPPSRVPVRAADNSGDVQPDDEVRLAQEEDGGTTMDTTGGGTGSGGGGGGSTPSASLTLTGDTYTDSAVDSEKNISFNATWSGGAKEDYVIVNWLKGFEKNDKGKPYKVSMYGKQVDFDFADWQVDSVDEDPAYWSKDGVRWRYNVDGPGKFSATDGPGPMNDSDGAGAQAKVSFKTAVYKSADVPSKTTGSLAATPLSSFQPWEYNVTVQGGGKFKH